MPKPTRCERCGRFVPQPKAEEQAEKHWVWLDGVFSKIPGGVTNKSLMEYLYKTAFVHGYKHGHEAEKEGEDA